MPPDFAGTIQESVNLTDAERAALEKASLLHRARYLRGEDRTRRGFGRRDDQDVAPGGAPR